jgi:hypothetical protein
MKIISSHYETLAKVECDCCCDSHYFEIKKVKEYENTCADDFVYFFKFTNFHKRSIISRIKKVLRLNKLLKNEMIDSVILSLSQIKEFNEVLREGVQSILNEQEWTKINTCLDIKIIEVNKNEEIDSYLKTIFIGADDLVIQFESCNGIIYSFDVGFKIRQGTNKKYLVDYILGKSEYLFETCEIGVTKNDLIELLSQLNAYLANVKHSDIPGGYFLAK